MAVCERIILPRIIYVSNIDKKYLQLLYFLIFTYYTKIYDICMFKQLKFTIN